MLDRFTHVHMIGIGGIGMSALAKWFLHLGKEVSGSDISSSAITKDFEQRGLKIFQGHNAGHVSDNMDLVVFSPAIPETNPERARARELGIEERSYPEMLGELSRKFSTIVVTGTNGKSTTTAMLGKILDEAGYDPTVLVGSLVPGFEDGNLRLGKSRFFVVEGCEYRAHMLHLEPEMIVLTNIEEDHLDYYHDLEHIKKTFQSFVDKLKGQGIVVVNADDPGCRSLNISRPIFYGSKKNQADYQFLDRNTEAGSQTIQTNQGELKLQIPGEFNVYNAICALSAAMELGVPAETCIRSLEAFPGIWRRFERIGVWHGAQVISDYGHHPTAIKGTVESAREFFPGHRIVLCYEPHQHSRTKELFDGFVQTLGLADVTVVNEIYDVAGRNEDHDISSQDVVEAIKKQQPHAQITFARDYQEAKSQLEMIVQEGDVLIIMGAGTIDRLARSLV